MQLKKLSPLFPPKPRVIGDFPGFPWIFPLIFVFFVLFPVVVDGYSLIIATNLYVDVLKHN